MGSISIELAFQIQVVAIFLFALILLLTVKDPESAWEERSLPDQKKSGSNITVLLAVFMASVFCASFATTAYDNAYNYYVKEALKFPNYYNGLIRAGIGGHYTHCGFYSGSLADEEDGGQALDYRLSFYKRRRGGNGSACIGCPGFCGWQLYILCG